MKRAKVVATAVAVSAVAGLSVAAVGTAHAGTSGQQVSVCVMGPDLTRITVEGHNQKGEKVEGTRLTEKYGCSPLIGYWWIGSVKIKATGSVSKRYADIEGTYNVPKNQDSNWFYVTFDAEPIA